MSVLPLVSLWPPLDIEHRLTRATPGPTPSVPPQHTRQQRTAPAPLCLQTDRILLSHAHAASHLQPSTHMCCFSHLSQTPRLFFQMGGEPKPGRLLRAQQPHENLAPLTTSGTAPAGRPDTTPGLSRFEGQYLLQVALRYQLSPGRMVLTSQEVPSRPRPTSSSELSSSYSSRVRAPASSVLEQRGAACGEKGRVSLEVPRIAL